MDIRDAVMSIYVVVTLAEHLPETRRKLRNMLMCVWYSCTVQYSRRKRTPMDIPTMVEGWKNVVLAMSIGHTKGQVDHAEFAMEELMTPLLMAPVKQLRAFWVTLQAALKADERVPFVIWKLFEAYGEVVVKDAPDQAIIALKTGLAREIAQLVEKDVQPDLIEAITGALKWRDPETLQNIKVAVEQGEKPRLKGRESCLFLVAGNHEVML